MHFLTELGRYAWYRPFEHKLQLQIPCATVHGLGLARGAARALAAFSTRLTMNLTFGPMSYCENYRVFHRHSSYERGLHNFGYSRQDARWMAAYRYDEVEAERDAGYAALQWAGPCEDYRDPTDNGCGKCHETYLTFRRMSAALEAECFARGVLARAEDGDRLFMVTLPIPMVAVRDRGSYIGGRIGSYQRLSKKKRKAHKAAFERKKKEMLSERGVVVGPEYMTKKRLSERKDAHKRWMSEHKDEYYQLECIKSDVMRSVVKSQDAFLERVPAQGGGFRYQLRNESVVDRDGVARLQYRLDRETEMSDIQRVRPPALRWLFKQFEMRVRKLGRERGFGIKYQAVIEQGTRGGFHYHILLHVFPVDGGSVPSDLADVLAREWFEVSGNIQFEDSDGGSWFRPVHNAEQAAAYVAKYIGKGWFSRRQTSKFLNLRTAARDARLVKFGFLTADIPSQFEREEDGFLSYKSPFSEEDIESVGTTEWVGLDIPKQAPGPLSLPDVKVAAVFWSSRPCRHPAGARSGICVNGDGVLQDLIPHCWWFPKDVLLGYLQDKKPITEQVQRLHDILERSKFRAITKAHAAVVQAPILGSVQAAHEDRQFGNLKSVFTGGRYPLRKQFDRLQKSVANLWFDIDAAFSRLGTARSAFATIEHARGSPGSRELEKKPSWYQLSERMRDRMRGGARARQESLDVTF